MKRHGFVALLRSAPWTKRANSILQRARQDKIEFGFNSAAELALYLQSIAPSRCPVFGFEFEESDGGGGFNPKSPSADRIVPARGYVRGNIQIISMKANEMKADASASELRQFANWILAAPEDA